MNKNKEKIIKSGALLVATALVLVVVTVAWFISGGNEATVDQIGADIESSGFGYTLLKAEDINKDGLLNAEDNDLITGKIEWKPVSETDMVINNIVPNQYHFYKAVIQPGSKTSLQMNFTGITVTVAPLIRTNFLSLINVRFRTENDSDPPGEMSGAGPKNLSMFDLLGESATEVNIYNIQDLNEYTGNTFTIYYDIGVKGESVPGTAYRDASVSIGAIQFIAS